MGRSIALVTGSSRGIGRAIALELARLGWNLGIHYAQNRSAAEDTAALCEKIATAAGHSIRVHIFQADLERPESRRKLIAEFQRVFDDVHLLVNNAGAAPRTRSDMLKIDESSFLENLSVNLIGPFFLSQQMANWMMERAEADPEAAPVRAIVFITSISSYTASTNRAEYCIAKAGLSMAAKLFAARLAQAGILVYEIRPGIIATDMTAPVKEKYDQLIQQGLTPIRRWGLPEDVAKAVAAIARGDFPFTTGSVFDVDGGFHLRVL